MRAFWALLVIATWTAPALGQATDTERAAARTLGTEGVEAYQAGRYAEAIDKLERAFNVVRAPSIGLWSARALARAGKWVEAAERYHEAARLDPTSGDVSVQRQAQADAVKERDELLTRLPALRIQVKGASPSARVTLDDVPLPSALLGAKVPVNPGPHVVELHDGYARVRRRIRASEGATVAIVLDANESAAPEAADGPPPQPSSKPGLSGLQVAGLVVGGTGLVSLGLSGYFAMSAARLDEQSKADSRCDSDNVCNLDGYNKRGEAINHATVATVTVVAGSVLAATGITLVVLGRQKARDELTLEARPELAAGHAGVSLCGSF